MSDLTSPPRGIGADKTDSDKQPERDLLLARRRARGLPPPPIEIAVAGRDDLTVCVALGGKWLAKVIRPESQAGRVPIEDYDRAYLYRFETWPIEGLDDLASRLGALADSYCAAVVRGAVADPARTNEVRRLLCDDPKTGDRATLVSAPRYWIALDVDNIPRPAGVPAADICACGRAAVVALPSEFHGVRSIVQATASHGIKPGCRLRLWYWASRPVFSRELKIWLRSAPVDLALFSAAQLTYTARPIFLGCTDHLPYRFAELPGAESVAVPNFSALAPPVPRRPASPVPTFTHLTDAHDYARAMLTNAAGQVLNAGEGNRHKVLVRAAAKLSRLVSGGAVAEAAARAVLVRAAEAVGLESEEAAQAIAWGLARPAENPFGETGND